MADHSGYLLALARLRILDAVYGPKPDTLADQRRAEDRERLKQARRSE